MLRKRIILEQILSDLPNIIAKLKVQLMSCKNEVKEITQKNVREKTGDVEYHYGKTSSCFRDVPEREETGSYQNSLGQPPRPEGHQTSN